MSVGPQRSSTRKGGTGGFGLVEGRRARGKGLAWQSLPGRPELGEDATAAKVEKTQVKLAKRMKELKDELSVVERSWLGRQAQMSSSCGSFWGDIQRLVLKPELVVLCWRASWAQLGRDRPRTTLGIGQQEPDRTGVAFVRLGARMPAREGRG